MCAFGQSLSTSRWLSPAQDPNVSAEFEADPMGYHGKLRIATGLAILTGILDANERFDELTMPLKIFHGTKDRVTSPAGSQKLYQEASSKDKDLELVCSSLSLTRRLVLICRAARRLRVRTQGQ
jgi:fermentation-respiration switch protein FrsA (DUF1100 family)